jgi:heme-degrading monooxygenase HmoA
MTTIGMHYDVLPGKEQTFVDGFLGVLEALKSVAGHEESHLYEDVQQKGSYLIVSQWTRMEDFQAFIRSDTFRNVTNWGKEEILKGRPRHKVYAQ